MFVHFHWDVITIRTFQQTQLGNICVYAKPCIHICLFFKIYLCIYVFIYHVSIIYLKYHAFTPMTFTPVQLRILHFTPPISLFVISFSNCEKFSSLITYNIFTYFSSILMYTYSFRIANHIM